MPETGKVRWFNSKKGYGWIIPDTGGGDIFFCHDDLTMKGAWPLPDTPVSYRSFESPRGRRAGDVLIRHRADGTCLLCGRMM